MLQLKIESMTCNHCISMVTKAIQQWQTDAKIEVDLSTQLVKIKSQLSKEEILDALDEA
jgi:copper chaperone